MRLKKDTVEAREKFVFDFFIANPKAPMREVNERLQATYGRRMRPTRVYSLRGRARNALASSSQVPDNCCECPYATQCGDGEGVICPKLAE